MQALRSLVLSLLALAGARGQISVVAVAMALIMGLGAACGIQPLSKLPGASPSATAGAGCVSFAREDGSKEVWCPPAPTGFRQMQGASPSPSPSATPATIPPMPAAMPGYNWVWNGTQWILVPIQVQQPGQQPQMPGQAPPGYQWQWSGTYWVLVPQSQPAPGYIPCIGCPGVSPTYYQPYPYPTAIGGGIYIPPTGTTIMGWDATTRVVTFRGVFDTMWAPDVVPANTGNPSDPNLSPAAATAAVKNGAGQIVTMGTYQYSYGGQARQGSWQNPPLDGALYGTYDPITDTIRVPQPASATNYEMWFAVVIGGRIGKWIKPESIVNYPKYLRWDPALGAGWKMDGQNGQLGPICRAGIYPAPFGQITCP